MNKDTMIIRPQQQKELQEHLNSKGDASHILVFVELKRRCCDGQLSVRCVWILLCHIHLQHQFP